MEFNSSNLRAKVRRLAQGQAPDWWIHALRALGKETELVQREFFEAEDAAAVVMINQLIAISGAGAGAQKGAVAVLWSMGEGLRSIPPFGLKCMGVLCYFLFLAGLFIAIIMVWFPAAPEISPSSMNNTQLVDELTSCRLKQKQMQTIWAVTNLLIAANFPSKLYMLWDTSYLELAVTLLFCAGSLASVYLVMQTMNWLLKICTTIILAIHSRDQAGKVLESPILDFFRRHEE